MTTVANPSSSPASPGRAPIPRGEHARERVLQAALELLAEEGLPGFTIEAVAQRAGASKATVYRRWASRAALLVDAMELAFQPFPFPATGRLRADLVELLTQLQRLLGTQPFPQLLAAAIDLAEHDPDLKGLHQELTERRREPVRQVLEQARQRGEIAATTDLELAIDLLTGPAFYRRFIGHRTFPEGYATTVVDYVLAAISYDRDPVPAEHQSTRDRPHR